ncbi:MAG: class I SAM-dependent methyltransferase [Acidobacteria bacterium]|nr:class I SAM-dependent methyltransferase [Acidobacteriota bacterium]
MANVEDIVRERTKQVAAEFGERGDHFGWFDEIYRNAQGDNEQIPWADLEPNKYFKVWADGSELKGDGKKALVVGCGLGDDAIFLHDLGFRVTAFDIAPTAIEWAKKLSEGRDIDYSVADLFKPDPQWPGAFDFVLEVYTIQPLPLEMRNDVIDAIAAFVKNDGELVIVTRGREDHEEPVELPWPVSRKELSRLETHGFKQTFFEEMPGGEDDLPIPRFVAVYTKG